MRNCGRGITTPMTGGSTSCPPGFSATRASSCDACGRRHRRQAPSIRGGVGRATNGDGTTHPPRSRPPAETWGELTFRTAGHRHVGAWRLPVVGVRAGLSHDRLTDRGSLRSSGPGTRRRTSWDAQDLANNQVAQLYGGYVLPGSPLDAQGGVGLVVSQWDTATGWPYRTMQFRVTLTDTRGQSRGDPAAALNLTQVDVRRCAGAA